MHFDVFSALQSATAASKSRAIVLDNQIKKDGRSFVRYSKALATNQKMIRKRHDR
ncbi:hypothetical protein GTP44_16605 [Duganella sp. FT50W]|uniref:Uncharacterized protein n=1 Tax=Duganella lactea TaxID=2692173 RepID=A0A6L8MLQ2_9BURK|nr:hypothetical protein [Duganella lactea]MYM83569.1 hypothetical protein [Duganella lactea]